jgi:hypothetical protein
MTLAAAALVLIAGTALAQESTTLNSRGPVVNPASNTVLAEVAGIAKGARTFRAVVSVAGISGAPATAVVLEWRDARNSRVKWSQGIVIPVNSTVTVPIEEAHAFEDGDALRLVVFTSAAGTVWGTLSVSR